MFEIISSNIFVKTGNSAFSNVYFRGFAEGLVVVEIISSNIFVKTGNSAFSNVYFRGFAEGLVVVEMMSSKMFARFLLLTTTELISCRVRSCCFAIEDRVVHKNCYDKFDQLVNHVV